MKVKTKIKDCHLIVRIKLSWNEKIDCTELDQFERLSLRGFLKPQQIRKNVIEYTGPVGINLYERMKKPISKHDFFYIIEHIVVAIKKIQGNSLSIDNIIWDFQNVYINEVTKEIQFLYIPMEGSSKKKDIRSFVESIVYSARPMQEKDMNYIRRFNDFVQNMSGFDIDRIEQYIWHEDKSVVSSIKKNNIGQSGFITNKRKDYYDYYDRKQADEEETNMMNQDTYEEMNYLYTDDRETGLMNEDNLETGMIDEDSFETECMDIEATGLLVDESEGTALLEDDTCSVITYPRLYRLSTDETISVNKPVFRIGKENSYVDYFVANNNAVSRSHADIITRGNVYYIVDLNSKNHTFVNDTMIPVKFEYTLNDNDRVRLGNEEFIFYV